MSTRPRNLIAVLVGCLASFGFAADPNMLKQARFDSVRIRSELGHSARAGSRKRPQRNGTRKRCCAKSAKRARAKAKRRAS